MNSTTKNEIMSIDKLKVQTVPAVLAGNFQELNKWLDNLLDNKVTIVTDETLSGEKKVIAELRKLAKDIDTKTKEVEALVSGDIISFKENMKALKSRVLLVADDKSDQVKVLEDQTREEIRVLLSNLLNIQFEELGVEQKFRRSGIFDLIKLTATTPSGALTKASITEVVNRAKNDLALQNKIAARLMAVENKSLRSEINPPLTEMHVQSFLYDDDFDSKLDELIKSELERKAEQEERLRKKLEAEKQREIDAALAKQKSEIEAKEKAEMAKELAKQKEELAEELSKQREDQEKANREQINALALELAESTKKTVNEIKQEEQQKLLVVNPEDIVDGFVNYEISIVYSVEKSFYTKTKSDVDVERVKKFYVEKLLKQEGVELNQIIRVTASVK
jgi:Protein of unknown function (DUF1351)